MGIEAAITQADGGAAPAGRPVRVRRALISVSDKTAVAEFARGLERLGVEILSTGGTAAALREAGVDVTEVSEFTGSEEILDGRVKTLHPRLHAALLARRDDPEHVATLVAEGIEPIDLVCVNLYPFERTVAQPGVGEAEAIENIDIGGPTMIRAAAKNHDGVAVVVRPESYDAVVEELSQSGGEISAETRHWLANEAFAHTAAYDAAISRWFGTRYEAYPSHWVMAHDKFLELSYGENPHQKAAFYVEAGARSHVLSRVAKQHGRALSFNNVLDLDSARRLLNEFEQPACVIIKHNNPCGVAIAATANEAYEKAFACDPLSAYGGVIVFNRPVDAALAGRLHEQFIEVLLAPGFDDDALSILTQKQAMRILETEEQRGYEPRERDLKRVRGGLLVQDPDVIEETRDGMTVATLREPERGRVERPAVLVDGLQARALECDRVRERRRDARDRSGTDEPCRLGADRGREGGRRLRRARGRAVRRRVGRLRRLLPVRRRAPRGRSRPGRSTSSSPAGRSATARSWPPATTPGCRW